MSNKSYDIDSLIEAAIDMAWWLSEEASDEDIDSRAIVGYIQVWAREFEDIHDPDKDYMEQLDDFMEKKRSQISFK